MNRFQIKLNQVTISDKNEKRNLILFIGEQTEPIGMKIRSNEEKLFEVKIEHRSKETISKEARTMSLGMSRRNDNDDWCFI